MERKLIYKISTFFIIIICALSTINSNANPALVVNAFTTATTAFKTAMKNPKFASDTKALALALGLTYLTLPKDTTSTESNKLPKTFGQNCGIDGLVFKGVTMSEALNFFESYKDLKYLYTYRYEYSPHMMIDVYDVIGTKNGLERKYSIQCHNGGATNTSDFQDSVIDPSKHDELANDIVKAAAAGNSQAIELLNLAFSMSNPTMTQDEIDDLIEQLQKSATQSGAGTQTGTTTNTNEKTDEKQKDETKEKEKDGIKDDSKFDFAFPDFCSWATPICNYLKTPELTPEKLPPLVVKDPNISQQIDTNKFNASGSCPADKQIQIPYGILNLSYWSFCEFLIKISPFVVVVGWISGAFIILGFRQN